MPCKMQTASVCSPRQSEPTGWGEGGAGGTDWSVTWAIMTMWHPRRFPCSLRVLLSRSRGCCLVACGWSSSCPQAGPFCLTVRHVKRAGSTLADAYVVGGTPSVALSWTPLGGGLVAELAINLLCDRARRHCTCVATQCMQSLWTTARWLCCAPSPSWGIVGISNDAVGGGWGRFHGTAFSRLPKDCRTSRSACLILTGEIGGNSNLHSPTKQLRAPLALVPSVAVSTRSKGTNVAEMFADHGLPPPPHAHGPLPTPDCRQMELHGRTSLDPKPIRKERGSMRDRGDRCVRPKPQCVEGCGGPAQATHRVLRASSAQTAEAWNSGVSPAGSALGLC